MKQQFTLPELDELLWHLVRGDERLHTIPCEIAAWYEIGFYDGFQSRQPEINALNDEADRLWMQAFAPAPKIDPNQPSYAELCRRRGDHAEAQRVEAHWARFDRFEVTRP